MLLSNKIKHKFVQHNDGRIDKFIVIKSVEVKGRDERGYEL